jgi:hypothetical protein
MMWMPALSVPETQKGCCSGNEEKLMFPVLTRAASCSLMKIST